MTTATHTLSLPSGALDVTLDVTVDEQGGHSEQSRSFLLLHGGAGPQTVTPFAGLLAGQRPARVFTPLHPGFGGTARPAWLADVPTLARVYARLLDELGLTDVTVVGNSIGGWIAAELALLGNDRISGVILVNAVGIDVPGHPVADASSLTPAELSRLAFHDPAKFAVDFTALPEAARTVMAANRAALEVYSGPHAMADPTLRERLAEIAHPALVAWGESDQVVDCAYGRAYAAAIPRARFDLLRGTGHMPQIETPEQLLPVVWDFADAHPRGRAHAHAHSHAVNRPNR
ncbi:alpha/beta fold hydrolase [Streptomyces sp. NRRL S-244]|uniref:alpha/beta fold hydrolase n=1 Tax=Streptomyces sp. NRRL S-244 TaxID=1463897 RepID=UPI000690A8F4|nr:alpha/beta hydrolase [Streptomyces sp. NRRL S-244]